MRAKTVNQLSDFPVRRTGSYRHKKSTDYGHCCCNGYCDCGISGGVLKCTGNNSCKIIHIFVFRKVITSEAFARQWCPLLFQVTDHTQRLGCAEAGGYAALKAHEFFAGTEWGSLHLQNPPELHPFLPANSEDSENLWSQYTVSLV